MILRYSFVHLVVWSVLFCFAATKCYALEWNLTPSVVARAGWVENVRLTGIHDDNAGVATIDASVDIDGKSRRARIVSSVGVRRTGYQNTDLDGETSTYLRFDAVRNHRKFSYGVRGDLRDDTLLRYSQLNDGLGDDPGDGLPGDPELERGILEDQVDRRSYLVSPHVGFELSRNWRVNFRYRHRAMRFDRRGEATGLTDSDQSGWTAELDRDMSSTDVLTVKASMSKLDADNGFVEDVDFEEVSLVWQRAVNTRTSWQVEVGNRTADAGDRGETDGLLVRGYLTHKMRRSALTGYVERSHFPSGSARVFEVDRFALIYERELGRKFSWDNRVIYSKVDRPSGSTTGERDYGEFSSKLMYELNRRWSVGVEYSFRQVDTDATTLGSGNADSHSVFATLEFRPSRRR